MGYKILGYAVWKGVKLYARRNFPNGRRNLAIAGAASAAIAGTAVAASRQQSQSN